MQRQYEGGTVRTSELAHKLRREESYAVGGKGVQAGAGTLIGMSSLRSELVAIRVAATHRAGLRPQASSKDEPCR